MTCFWKFEKNQFNKTSPVYVAYNRAFSLLDKIRELKAEKKTSAEGPEKLLNIMKKITEGCIKKVHKLSKELLKEKIEIKEQKNIENTTRNIVLTINVLHTFLRYIDATRLSRNPTGMIRPWELLTRRYIKDVNIIIRPQWKYNYSYYNMITILKSINHIIRDEETALLLEKEGLYFPILSFAGLERDNVLLHVVLAHEIGHFIDQTKDISSIKKYEDDISKIFKMETILEKLKTYYGLSLRIADEEDKLKGIIRDDQENVTKQHTVISEAQIELLAKIVKWLEEITADIIAVRVIGPSFIFALYQTQLAQVSKMGPVGDYPPP
jgi:hypothetical protein